MQAVIGWFPRLLRAVAVVAMHQGMFVLMWQYDGGGARWHEICWDSGLQQ